MDIVYGILVVLHLLGWATVLGAALATMKSPKITPGMLHGVLTALVTGIALVGIREAGLLDSSRELDMAKIAIKLGIALVVTALVIIGRRRESVSTGYLGGIAGLVVVNVAVAVLW